MIITLTTTGGDEVEVDISNEQLVALLQGNNAAQALLKANIGSVVQAKGLISEALGDVHYYPLDPDTQKRIQAAAERARKTGLPLAMFCMDGSGFWDRVNHTAEQLIAVGNDLVAYLAANIPDYDVAMRAVTGYVLPDNTPALPVTIDKQKCLADASDAVTITGIPADTTYQVSANNGVSETGDVTDDTLVITFDDAAVYRVALFNVDYLRYEVIIHAT